MIQIKSITTRPVLPQDDDFIYKVYASTRAEELALVPWTEEQKDAFVRMQFELRERQYRAEYPEAVTEMILCDGIPAGTMITLKMADAIRLVDIALLPHFRGAGIGATILRRLHKEGKKISLHVLKQNPAMHLYSRLGFVSVNEDSMYLQMEWSPQ
jgi:ribosomal protein S18 acetylase RimI-like enzyme